MPDKRDALYVDDLYDDNVALRAEIERLILADRQWADHVKRLSEENERLQNVHHADQYTLTLQAREIERLRPALEKIAAYVQVETVNPFYFVQVAREALGRDDGGQVNQT